MFLVSPFLFYQAMCLLAGVVYLSDGEAEVPVELPRLGAAQLDVPEPRGGPAVLAADEAHEQHVRPQQDRPRAEDARVVQPRQVAHLLLRPRANHLARVLLPVALPEPELAGDVLVPEKNQHNVRIALIY